MSLTPFKQKRGRPRLIKIPKTFEVLGHTITTKLIGHAELKELYESKKGKPEEEEWEYDGLYDHDIHTIYLNEALSGDAQMVAWMHEKTHCLLYSMGQDELSDDEDFVDMLAELLYQSLKSQKGRLN